MQGATTQQPRTLLERVLEGKRREYASLEADLIRNSDLFSAVDLDYMAELRESINKGEQHLAQQEQAHA